MISRTAMIRQGQPSEILDTEKIDNRRLPLPRSWVRGYEVLASLPVSGKWIGAWRKVTSPSNERSFAWTALPVAGAGDNLLLCWSENDRAGLLPAVGGSLIVDYVARQKLWGINFQYYVANQIPFVDPTSISQEVAGRLMSLAVELTYTAWDMAGFAADLGYYGPPFRWEEDRRALLRAELDALMFRLYGVDRDEVDYILDTFPIVKRKDEAAFGEYRTKRLILERFDAMEAADAAGVDYQTALDPPPAHPAMAHDPSTRPAWADWYLRNEA